MIVVDVETTGTDPKIHSIVSIGTVDIIRFLDGNRRNSAFFYGECTIWKGAKIEPKALEINGFTETEAKYTNPEEHRELINRWLGWIRDSRNRTICGENPAFDMNFLKAGMLEEDYPEDFVQDLMGNRSYDLHTLSYDSHQKNMIEIPMKNKRSALSLDETLKYVGLTPESKPHNGLIGAILEAEAYWRMTYFESLFGRLHIGDILPGAFPHSRAVDIPDFSLSPLPDYLRKKHR